MSWSASLVEKARAVRLFAMDVDGVLTNGDIIYNEQDGETKIFNVKDGHGLAMLAYHKFATAWITGRTSVITERRAKELKITHLHQGIKQKLPVMEAIMAELGLEWDQVAYIGDDTPDVDILKRVGLSVCPADAIDLLKGICVYTSPYAGGRGAVRDVCDLIMYAQNMPVPGLAL